MEISFLSRRMMSSASIAMCLALTGCFDDNYDLSDIDTTVQVSVNDLVLPIRIDAITLSDLITIDEDSRLQVVDGCYALVEDGTFQSDPVKINPISINPPHIDNIAINASAASASGASAKAIGALSLGRYTSSFNYSANNISDCIKSISRVGTDFNVKLTIAVNDPSGTFSSCNFTGLQLQLPAGLVGTPSTGSYDINTGIADLGNVTVNGGSFDYTMAVTAIDASKAAIDFSATSHTFRFADEIGIAGGQIAPAVTPATIPSSVGITVSFDLSTLSITSFSGELKYSIADFNIAPITLNDLPDVLNQPETNLSLDNPQIYLTLDNPLAAYGITAETGLSITPWRGNTPAHSYGLDNGTLSMNRNNKNAEGKYLFCLSPEQPSSYIPGYAGANFEPYSGLRDILKGAGLPDELRVSVVNPGMPLQSVSNLPIGNLGTLSGSYSLFAPLALGAGSEIIYSDTEAGWNDEDVDKITIRTLEVSATVTNNLPVSVTLSGYPVDIDCNRIGNVEISSTEISGGTTNKPFKIHMTGTINHLDGITFTARATSPGNGTALSPDLKIVLTDIRATVSGYYVNEL